MARPKKTPDTALMLDVARLYYEKELTKQKIAQRLRIDTREVTWLLGQVEHPNARLLLAPRRLGVKICERTSVVADVATLDGKDNFGGARLVVMTLPEAQRMTGHHGYDSISVSTGGQNADQVANDIGSADGLSLGVDPTRGDHGRQMFDQLSGHLPGDSSVSDDDPGPQHGDGDPSLAKKFLYFTATSKMLR